MPQQMECVACGMQQRKRKLLRCLHSLCVDCLPKNLTRANEISCPWCKELTPPPPTGKTQILWLPDSVASTGTSTDSPQPKAENQQQQQHQQNQAFQCDECLEHELAVFECPECPVKLCEVHSKAHSLSRSSYNHRLVRIKASTASSGTDEKSVSQRPPVAGKFCILHPDDKVQKFCVSCKDLLCDLCMRHGHDASHSLLDVEEAAGRMRERVQSMVLCDSAENGADASGSVVGNAIGRVNCAIDTLHNRTLHISEQVEQYFDTMAKLLKTRQEKLLAELDGLRMAKLKRLDKQKRQLRESQQRQEKVSTLLSSCTDPHDFVLMAGWLEEAAQNVNDTAEKDCKPCVTSKLIFTEKHHEETTAAISRAGIVFDIGDIDFNASTLECPQDVSLNKEVIVNVKAVSTNGQVMKAADVTKRNLEVKVSSSGPESEAQACLLSDSQDGTCVIASYRPAATGSHKITASFAGYDIIGSPAGFLVTPEISTFDSSRCHPTIRLSNDNKTATKTGRGFRSVCGTRRLMSNNSTFQVRVDNTRSGYIMISVCNVQNPRLSECQRDQAVFGFSGYNSTSYANQAGTQLGQRWRNGDIISLSLDSDRCTITGRLQRTGQTQTIESVWGDLSLYISMYEEGDSVTLLA